MFGKKKICKDCKRLYDRLLEQQVSTSRAYSAHEKSNMEYRNQIEEMSEKYWDLTLKFNEVCDKLIKESK